MYYGLPPLGVLHTIVSVITVVTGVVLFFRFTEITSKPWLPNADAPELAFAGGVMFLILIVGCAMQVLRMRNLAVDR